MDQRRITDDAPLLVNEDRIGELEETQNSEDDSNSHLQETRSSRLGYLTVSILTFTNLLNYMDRFTVAGVLQSIKDNFFNTTSGGPSNTTHFGNSSIDDSSIQEDHLNELGLIQTSFILSYMIFSPVFGYLGDRYNRKVLMSVGILFWSGITLGSSFTTKTYWSFLLMRSLVGIGEASYSTIAPTIIADLFVGSMRTNMLSLFYFAIPVGSGLGYIIASGVEKATGDWRWSLRITPVFGIVCVLLIIWLVKEPARGASEGGSHLRSSSLKSDVVYLAKNRSFMLSSLGFTCVAFVTGALAFWAPYYLNHSILAQAKETGQKPKISKEAVSMIFGSITCVAGIIGVAIGWNTAKLLRKYTEKADPLICAFGMLSCSPFLFLALYLSKKYLVATWIFIFIGETLLCMNWPIVADILLYVVVPNRRSIAEAGQILMSHAFGDAGSPFLIGQIAGEIAKLLTYTHIYNQYKSLQYSLYINCFICVLGGGFFLANAVYIIPDKLAQKKAVKESADGLCSEDKSLPNTVLND